MRTYLNFFTRIIEGCTANKTYNLGILRSISVSSLSYCDEIRSPILVSTVATCAFFLLYKNLPYYYFFYYFNICTLHLVQFIIQNQHIHNTYINRIYRQHSYVFCDCASWQILIIKSNRCTHFSILFWNETLHVSGSSFVHHKEFFHCTNSNGLCHTSLLTAV